MRSVWQISMGQLFMLVTLAAIYLGVMAQGISLPTAIVWVGNVFNAVTTATFFLSDKPWAETTPRWSHVIRNIMIGTLCGGLHGLGITESLRRMQYWVWSADWIYFAGWMGVQLVIAGITYMACRGALAVYRARLMRPAGD